MVPLHEEADGTIRVGGSRVLLEIIIRAFQDGATPETIVQRYPTLTLADAYAVIAGYLHHRAEMEAYLETREERARQVRGRIDAHQGDLSDIRARLVAARDAQG